ECARPPQLEVGHTGFHSPRSSGVEGKAIDRVVDEKDRVTRIARVLEERRQQLPLPLRVRLPPPHLRHACPLLEAESRVTLLTSPQFSPGAVATCAGCAPSPARGAEARGETRIEDARRRIAQRGGGGALGAPMRRRPRRPIEAPGSAAPNRSGEGAPASPHRRPGS